MKNKKEIYEALLEGKRLCNSRSKYIIKLNSEGNLVDEHGSSFSTSFNIPSTWSIKEECNIYSKYRMWFIADNNAVNSLHYWDRSSPIRIDNIKEGVTSICCTCCNNILIVSKKLEVEKLKEFTIERD